jgi:FkbM family methyltransferase
MAATGKRRGATETSSAPLLSIAIPAYGRPKELKHCLDRFCAQIAGKYDRDVEILVSDDATPDDALRYVRQLAERQPFIRYRRYSGNIGLERNLIACTDGCTGEFLWIFGDDDFLEPEDALDQVMGLLRKGEHDFYVLNRTRRSFDLTRLVTDNWMRLKTTTDYPFPGLREFCLTHGFISVIGFISVNIFRRRPFQQVDPSPYMGTMYPQLGSMLEAFHDRPTLLVGRPLVCHRTQTSVEKKAALGSKRSEADFMADERRRNAIYFSHPYVRMLAELIRCRAFLAEDITRIPENTVINGLLIDFLLQTVELNRDLGLTTDSATWSATKAFFGSLPLDATRQRRAANIFAQVTNTAMPTASPRPTDSAVQALTISVISPSFNQAEFLEECLASVRDQSYPPIEHLVFDPGSTDGSRERAARFPHVTLIAEPDSGQSDALNKGFARARGDIVAWLNSDDCFADTAVFDRVVRRFLQPDAPDIIYGKGIYINENGKKLRDVYVNKDPSTLNWRFQQEDGILQPALFMRRSVIERVGPLRNDLHYSMDYEYWIRCVKAGIKFVYLDDNLAIARYHSNNKTYGMRGKSYAEVCDMMKEHFGYVNHVWLKRYAEFIADGFDGVLANAANTGVQDADKLDTAYRELLRDYNTDFDTFARLTASAASKGYGDTHREMIKLGVLPAVRCKPIPLEQVHEAGHVAYTVGPRRWAYDAKWKAGEIEKAHAFLRGRIRERRNDICVIVGNGPSLNQTNLALLKGQDVIISNNAFLSAELREYATYHTTVNYLVAEQSSHHINRLQRIQKVFPYWLAYCLNPSENTHFVDAVGRPEFSTDMFKNMSWRHTVTFFNLHLAYGLGYRRVIMIGFDHTYKQPKGVAEQEIIHSYEEDENHFHPGYFRGKKWQAADVDMMEEMYRLANEAFLADGREIINSTVGGKLELFPRMSLAQALAGEALTPNPPSSQPLIGPFSRDEGVHLDETDAVAALFSNVSNGHTMIDVGAHHGTALAPFLDRQWQVFAFEPDEKNRAKLLERLAKHPHRQRVTLDQRCVSDKSRDAAPFFRSEQSTGISSLSAFHASHSLAQSVDVVSLADYFSDRDLPPIDFLKVDTEGHDFFVLQGFPWDRSRPAVIECEFEDAKTVPLGYTVHDLAKFLASKGYTVYLSEWHPIVRYGIRHQWRRLCRYPCDLDDNTGWGNLLAFREPIEEATLLDAVRRVLTRADRKVAVPGSPPARSVVAEVSQAGPPSPTRSFKTITTAHFSQLCGSTWRCAPTAGERPLWQAIFTVPDATAARTHVGGLRLRAEQPLTLIVSLSRHGASPYEGESTRITLQPNVAQTVRVRHRFAHQHTALRLQIEVTEAGIGPFEIAIDSVSLGENLTSLREHVTDRDLQIGVANRLYRDGQHTKALGLYLLMYELRGHAMYLDNARMVARRLELVDTDEVGALRQLLS